MIATVLVDLRMNNNNNLNHSRVDSSAETDEQLTESEASRDGGAPSDSMSDYSHSEVDASRDDISEEDIHELQHEGMHIRRRKLGISTSSSAAVDNI